MRSATSCISHLEVDVAPHIPTDSAPGNHAGSISAASSTVCVRAALTEPRRYTVEKGDTLYSIARRFGLTVPQILAANPCVKDEDMIYAGEVLLLLPAETANKLM